MCLAPMAIEKINILGAVLELPANRTANPAHLPQNWAKSAKSAVLFSLQLQTARRILIFSIATGAEYLSYVNPLLHLPSHFLGILFWS